MAIPGARLGLGAAPGLRLLLGRRRLEERSRGGGEGLGQLVLGLFLCHNLAALEELLW